MFSEDIRVAPEIILIGRLGMSNILRVEPGPQSLMFDSTGEYVLHLSDASKRPIEQY